MRLLFLGLTFASILAAQAKLPPTPAEYGQWETLVGGGRGGGAARALSPDGKWLAYGITRSNGQNELRIAKVSDTATKVVAFGSIPTFSSDNRWLAYRIGYSEAQTDRMRKDKKPVHNKLGIMNLATGDQTVVDSVDSFSFSPSGKSLAMLRYGPEKPAGDTPAPTGRGGGGRGGNNAGGDSESSAPLLVRDPATGRDTALGDTNGHAWQDVEKKGHLLAVAISNTDKIGNGIEIYDAETGTVRVLDSAVSSYSGLAWRKDSSDLTVLRSISDEKRDGDSNAILAWTHIGEPSEAMHKYEMAPSAMRIVNFRKPSWSENGENVFVGVAAWDEKAPVKRGARNAPKENAEEDEEPAAVDVWHWRDADVNPKQKKSANQDKRRNMLAVWHVNQNSFVQLAQDFTGQVVPLKHQNLAYATQWKAYALERSIGRPAADLSLIDLSTGTATKLKDRLKNDRYLQQSPNGRYLLYVQNDHYWTVDTATRATVNITKSIKTSFIDTESDDTIEQLPPFGVAGWTKDDREVILYDKFDLWRVAADGSKATRLTDGSAEQIRFRHARLDPEEEFIDTSKPMYLSMFGIWTKKSGYARLNPDSKIERLIWADKSIDRLMQAKDAPVFAYVSQTFVESPNEFVSGPDLKEARKISDTNPFQSKYAWSREELVDYKNAQGVRLQGALYYPAGYEPGKKYPMVVYMYEKLSDGLHHYNAPSERSYYSASAITSHGYFLLMPDIVFRPHEPGLSVVDCVESAVAKVVSTGMVDAKKVGVVGHSWGGFDSVFLATHSKVLAAAVAGAPITDLVSNYGNHHWSSGIAETDHIETGQQRMQVPIYEDLQAYIRNSAVFNVQNMTVPLLIEVGDSDGTVFFHQGVELYNIARRAKKEVVLIEYAGEDHGLSKKADQIDYQRRIFAWFGHYLKGEPAPSWIENGESYLDHQKELKTAAPARN